MKSISVYLSCCFLLLSYGIGRAQSNKKIKLATGAKVSVTSLDQAIKKAMQTVEVPGLSIAIINKKKIVYQGSYGLKKIGDEAKIDEHTLFEGGALAEPLLAFYAMKLVETGLLNLDRPLYEYLPHPDLADNQVYQQITARMVLSHCSGFPTWRRFNKDNKLDVKFPPGTQFLYSGEGFQYLAMVLAQLNQMDSKELATLLQSEFFATVGMQDSYLVWNEIIAKHKAHGHFKGKPTDRGRGRWDGERFDVATGLHTNAHSYAQFLIAILKKKGLKKNLLGEMLKAQISLPDQYEQPKYQGLSSWGLGFAVQQTALGNKRYVLTTDQYDFQAYAALDLKQKFGIVVFSNSGQLFSLLQELGPLLKGD